MQVRDYLYDAGADMAAAVVNLINDKMGSPAAGLMDMDIFEKIFKFAAELVREVLWPAGSKVTHRVSHILNKRAPIVDDFKAGDNERVSQICKCLDMLISQSEFEKPDVTDFLHFFFNHISPTLTSKAGDNGGLTTQVRVFCICVSFCPLFYQIFGSSRNLPIYYIKKKNEC